MCAYLNPGSTVPYQVIHVAEPLPQYGHHNQGLQLLQDKGTEGRRKYQLLDRVEIKIFLELQIPVCF